MNDQISSYTKFEKPAFMNSVQLYYSTMAPAF